MCFISIPEIESDIEYKRTDIWKNPDGLQQLHKTPYFPISNLKNIYNSNDPSKIVDIEKVNGVFSIFRDKEYSKGCLNNYFIKKEDECPITDIILEKQKVSTHEDYQELEISSRLIIYYKKGQITEGNLYKDISIKQIESLNCDGDDEFMLNDICINIILSFDFDYKSIELLKNEINKYANDFKIMKNYSNYSDKICVLLLIISFIYDFFEPYNEKVFNYFKILSWIFQCITFILFIIRYTLFYKIKQYFYENEIIYKSKDEEDYDYYFPKQFFNLDSIILSVSISSIIFYPFYWKIPTKCHFKSESALLKIANEKFPYFKEDFHKS